MNLSAIIMMLVAMAVIWGGLVLVIVLSMRSPRATDPHPHRDL